MIHESWVPLALDATIYTMECIIPAQAPPRYCRRRQEQAAAIARPGLNLNLQVLISRPNFPTDSRLGVSWCENILREVA